MYETVRALIAGFQNGPRTPGSGSYKSGDDTVECGVPPFDTEYGFTLLQMLELLLEVQDSTREGQFSVISPTSPDALAKGPGLNRWYLRKRPLPSNQIAFGVT